MKNVDFYVSSHLSMMECMIARRIMNVTSIVSSLMNMMDLNCVVYRMSIFLAPVGYTDWNWYRAGHEGVHMLVLFISFIWSIIRLTIRDRCNPSEHLCGKPCILGENRGCQGNCTKVRNNLMGTNKDTNIKLKVFNHTDDEHLCSARRHFCAKVVVHLDHISRIS